MYPSKWKGSTEPDDISGIATFKIEGVEYTLKLDCFTSCQVVLCDTRSRRGGNTSFAPTLRVSRAATKIRRDNG